MVIDSIKTKSKPTQTSTSTNRSKIVIPVIIILFVIVILWLITLRHNFSRLNSTIKLKSESTQEVNQALKDLSQKLNQFKEQKVFSQSTSSQSTPSNFQEQTSDTSTNGHIYPSDKLPMPDQQY